MAGLEYSMGCTFFGREIGSLRRRFSDEGTDALSGSDGSDMDGETGAEGEGVQGFEKEVDRLTLVLRAVGSGSSEGKELLRRLIQDLVRRISLQDSSAVKTLRKVLELHPEQLKFVLNALAKGACASQNEFVLNTIGKLLNALPQHQRESFSNDLKTQFSKSGKSWVFEELEKKMKVLALGKEQQPEEEEPENQMRLARR